MFMNIHIISFWLPLWYLQTLLSDVHAYNTNKAYRWCSGYRVRLEFGRSWFRTPIGSNQRLKFVFVASPLSTHHWGERAETDWIGIMLMCPSWATCLFEDWCFIELAQQKSNSACWSCTKRTSSSSHWKLTCSHHDRPEHLLNCC